ncbi:MAG: sigma-54 dependent transcriptional regulator [Myxococcota bacterium]
MTAPSRILLVDDDELFTTSIEDYLGDDPVEVTTAATYAGAKQTMGKRRFDLALLDQSLPDGRGMELARHFLEGNGGGVILITAHADIGDAAAALKLGLDDYLIKPVDLARLRFAVLRSLQAHRDARLARVAHHVRRSKTRLDEMTTTSPPLRGALLLAQRGANTRVPILITGETGTGKTMVARAIHDSSDLAEGPFVSVNCGAIPRGLIEAELFGTTAGAFTGATDRPGLFELATGGTLFLDELGELPLEAQASLLAAIEERQIRRVGGGQRFPVDVRIIAATHVDLDEAVARKAFRPDLRYRLGVLEVALPPLRRRPEDLRDLIRQILRDIAPHRQGDEVPDEELQHLATHPWAGNIRELRNVLERTLLMAPSGPLRPSRYLPRVRPEDEEGAAEKDEPPPSSGRLATLAELEKRHIGRALRRFRGHRLRAALALGISPATLRRRLAHYRTERSN